jgi:hypothetical protein
MHGSVLLRWVAAERNGALGAPRLHFALYDPRLSDGRQGPEWAQSSRATS